MLPISRVLACIAVFGVSYFFLWLLFGEVAVLVQRLDLIDDFWIAFFLVFVSYPASVLGALVAAILAWRSLPKTTS